MTELTDVIWSSERLWIYGFMALYKYFIIIIISAWTDNELIME